MFNETELEARYRRAKEAYEAALEAENQAIRNLAAARRAREIAKERQSEAFRKNEDDQVRRRLADYRHSTI